MKLVDGYWMGIDWAADYSPCGCLRVTEEEIFYETK